MGGSALGTVQKRKNFQERPADTLSGRGERGEK